MELEDGPAGASGRSGDLRGRGSIEISHNGSYGILTTSDALARARSARTLSRIGESPQRKPRQKSFG
jgi:hypothetical protein